MPAAAALTPALTRLNGCDWPGHKRQRSTLHLYRNNRNGTFTDVSRAAGLDVCAVKRIAHGEVPDDAGEVDSLTDEIAGVVDGVGVVAEAPEHVVGAPAAH